MLLKSPPDCLIKTFVSDALPRKVKGIGSYLEEGLETLEEKGLDGVLGAEIVQKEEANVGSGKVGGH